MKLNNNVLTRNFIRSLQPFAVLSMIMFAPSLLQAQCPQTNNYFETHGGGSSDAAVKGSSGCMVMEMDDGFETITLKMGSLPTETATYTLINHDEEPAEGEISVKYFYHSGNEPETLPLASSGQTATICSSNGVVQGSWEGVKFKGSVNGNITYNTKCRMRCQ